MSTVTREGFLGKDFVSIQDYSFEEINFILAHAQNIEEDPEKYRDSLYRKKMLSLFFEDSTRTRTSFLIAMMDLGGNVIDEDMKRSSINKGETLRDTVKNLDKYPCDVFVIRHSRDGAARFVADNVETPVINAGDGKNQHPTQTLLDLYSIKKVRGEISGTNIVLAGDLKYGRTVHSLALALSRYKDVKMCFISPDTLRMPENILKKLEKQKIIQGGLIDLENSLAGSDIVYMTRVQRERFPEGPEGDMEYEKISKEYRLTLDMLKNVQSGFKVFHPLPKISEIDPKIDDTVHAYYFDQARNGVHVRKALLDLILGGKNGS